MASPRNENVALLASMIKDIQIAMLTTRSRDGHYVSRPVATLDAEFDGDLWFFTSASSHKAKEIKAHPRVNVSYASTGDNTYVSVSGTASVKRDRKMIDRLWNDAMKLYFPNGKDDADVTLVRVKVETAEYWDGPGSLAGKALSFVLAAVTQDPDAMGDNRTLKLGRGAKATVVRSNTRGDSARKALSRAGSKAVKKTTAKKSAAVRTPVRKTAKKTTRRR